MDGQFDDAEDDATVAVDHNLTSKVNPFKYKL